jgi:hypothetical protein
MADVSTDPSQQPQAPETHDPASHGGETPAGVSPDGSTALSGDGQAVGASESGEAAEQYPAEGGEYAEGQAWAGDGTEQYPAEGGEYAEGQAWAGDGTEQYPTEGDEYAEGQAWAGDGTEQPAPEGGDAPDWSAADIHAAMAAAEGGDAPDWTAADVHAAVAAAVEDDESWVPPEAGLVSPSEYASDGFARADDQEDYTGAAWGGGLSEDDWARISETSVLERTIAGWDLWSFTLDGMTVQHYYQQRKTGQSQWEAPIEVTRALAAENRSQQLNEYGYEGLDVDDDPRPWVPPTRLKAFRARQRRIFGGGKAPYCATTEEELASLGVGVSLYMRLLRTLGLYFLFIGVLYIPSLIMFYNGSRIPESYMDPIRAAQFTLGNIGSRSLAAQATSVLSGATPDFATLPHGPVDGYSASYVVSFLDLAAVILFLLIMAWFNRRIDLEVNQAEKRVVRARDYTIYVRNLPKDATEPEIRDFFSERFSLDDLDAEFRRLDGQPGYQEEVDTSSDAIGGRQIGLLSRLRQQYSSTRALKRQVKQATTLLKAANAFSVPAKSSVGPSALAPVLEDGGSLEPGGKEEAPVAATSEGATADSKPSLSKALAMVGASHSQLSSIPGGPGHRLAVSDVPATTSNLRGHRTTGSDTAYKLPVFEKRDEMLKRAHKRGESTSAVRGKHDVSVVGFTVPGRPGGRKHRDGGSPASPEVMSVEKALRDRLAIYSGASLVDHAENQLPTTSAEESDTTGVAFPTPHTSKAHGGRTTRAGGKRFDFGELTDLGVSTKAGLLGAAAHVKVVEVRAPVQQPPTTVKAAANKAGGAKRGPRLSASESQLKDLKDADEIRVVALQNEWDPVSIDGDAESSSGHSAVPLGVQPVLDVGHSSKLDYLGSWVAEVSIIRGNGARIRAYRAAENLSQRLRNARAQMKMFRKDTPLGRGADAQAFELWSKKVDDLGSRLAELRNRLGSLEVDQASQHGRSFLGTSVQNMMQQAAAAVDAATGSAPPSKESDCHGAFVTFNSEESFLRAVAAYRGSHRWFFRCCQAPMLRFRGKYRLEVVQAPDPSDLLWENLSTSPTDRCCRRTLTGVSAFLLLIGAFLLVLLAQAAKSRLSTLIPDLSRCDKDLPAAFMGGFTNATDAFGVAGGTEAAVKIGTSSPIVIDRPTGIGMTAIQQGELDQLCGTGNYYLGYINPSFTNFVVGGYPTSSSARSVACGTTDPSGGSGLPAGVVMQHAACPNPITKLSGQCPCVPASSTVKCSTIPCFFPSLQSETVKCEQFPINTIVGCFCLSALQRALTQHGPFVGTTKFIEANQDVCGTFATSYAQVQSLTVIAAGSAAIVNVLLAALMKCLVNFERHVSISEKSRALVSKTTIAQVFNTAVVAILVKMTLPNNEAQSIAILNQLNILQGEHDSFQWAWYVDVGFTIFSTLVITAILSAILPLASYCAVLFRRVRVGGSEAIQRRGTVATQHDYDALYVGRTIQLADMYPPLLALSMVTLVYCAGMPLLAPIVGLALMARYAMDKWLLLRFVRKPPAYTGTLARFASELLPYAVVGHCIVAIFMLGQADVLPSHLLPSARNFLLRADSSGVLATALTSAQRLDSIGISARMARWNTVFFAILGTGLLALLIVQGWLWNMVLNAVAACGLGDACSCSCCSEDIQGLPMRKWIAPYTGIFGRVLDERADAWRQRTLRERLPGWLACCLCLCCCDRQSQETQEEIAERMNRVRLNTIEKSQGWRIERLGHIPVIRKLALAHHEEDTKGGTAARPTELRLKSTWEVINDVSGLASYDISANPEYSVAVLTSKTKKQSPRDVTEEAGHVSDDEAHQEEVQRYEQDDSYSSDE